MPKSIVFFDEIVSKLKSSIYDIGKQNECHDFSFRDGLMTLNNVSTEAKKIYILTNLAKYRDVQIFHINFYVS